VQDVKNTENALPLQLKQRPRLNPQNRLLAPSFFPTDSLDLPYGAITMILDKTLTAVDGKPDHASTSIMYLLGRFTTIKHKRLQESFPRHQLQVGFLQELFFLYGPNLIFKCEDWFRENFNESAECMDCYCLWMAASLYCSAWFDDATFDRILVSIMAPVPSILNELKISYIEKF
jgi:hypothetical protein